MANIESLNRRLDRLKAASGGGKLRVIWRDKNGEFELPDDGDPDSDDVLIITWRVGGDELPPPPVDL